MYVCVCVCVYAGTSGMVLVFYLLSDVLDLWECMYTLCIYLYISFLWHMTDTYVEDTMFVIPSSVIY